ncbi:hypothetical protein ILUMI_05339, partial [Ignelater luminosus]
ILHLRNLTLQEFPNNITNSVNHLEMFDVRDNIIKKLETKDVQIINTISEQILLAGEFLY